MLSPHDDGGDEEQNAEGEYRPIGSFLEATTTSDDDELTDLEIGLAASIRIVIAPDAGELHKRALQSIPAHRIKTLAEGRGHPNADSHVGTGARTAVDQSVTGV